MQRRRPRRRRSALLRLCASDSPVPHTKGLLLPTFCRLSAFGPPPGRLPGLRGAPGRLPRAARPRGRPPLAGQTSPNFPQTRRAGEGPWPEARMRPARSSEFPGFRRAGVESDECPRRPAWPPAPRAVGAWVLSVFPRGWKWLPGAGLSAVLLSLRMEVSKRGSWKRRAGRGANGPKEARSSDAGLLWGGPG